MAAPRGSVLSLAIVCGAVCGLIDAAALQWNFLGSRGWFDYLPPSIWVSSPAVFVGLLVVTVLPLVLLPQRHRGAVAVAVLTLVGPGLIILVRVAIPLRLLAPRTSYFLWAVATFAVIAPLSWFASRAADKFWRARWIVSSAIVVGAALAVCGLISALSKAKPVAAGARRDAKPNVILVFLDTLRFDSSGMARGHEELAPSLARFASAAMVFENAWAPTPWTLPSHLSVFTGLGEPELGISYDQQTYSGPRPTLAQIFRRSGYSTTAVLANGFLNPGTGFQLGFDSFDYAAREVGVCRTSLATMIHTVSPEWARLCRPTGRQVTQRAIATMSRSPRPFFLTLNYMDVHAPYDVQQECRHRDYTRFRPIDEYPILDRVNRFAEPVPLSTQRLMKANYASAMGCLDRSLGELFSAIDALPDARNTYVIVVGDHGEQFGEHNLVLHSNSVYGQVLHVPLAIRGPRLSPQRLGKPVSITWLYGTLLHLAGIPGRELPSLIDGTPALVTGAYRVPHRVLNIPARLAFDATSLVSGPFHYIRWANGKYELYDLRTDPEEAQDIAHEDRMRETQRALDAALQTAMSGARPAGEGRKRFFSLGYIQ